MNFNEHTLLHLGPLGPNGHCRTSSRTSLIKAEKEFKVADLFFAFYVNNLTLWVR